MNDSSLPPMVRLSWWVRILNSGNTDFPYFAQHALWHGSKIQIPLTQHEYYLLMRCDRFRMMSPELEVFYRKGLLVGCGEDPVSALHAQLREKHGIAEMTAEMNLILSYEHAYWMEEFESHRNYRWRGHPICKSPDDLFFYQELMHDSAIESVLEIGCGRGGSASFFRDMFTLNRPFLENTVQSYVGVDTEDPDPMIFDGSHQDDQRSEFVKMWCIRADAHGPEAYALAEQIASDEGHSMYDLVIIDADPSPMDRIRFLSQYAPLVGIGGYIVIEDTSTPEMTVLGDEVSAVIDEFLCKSDMKFAIVPEASRFPTGRSRLCFQRRR